MGMIQRSLLPHVAAILNEYGKMAFVSGPRQVGKTTLAGLARKSFHQGLYFNWDVITDQKKLLKNPYFFEEENREPAKPFLVVLDEIHKYARWKNYLKGAYDRFGKEFRFLVTGSGRLDIFKRGGDSLLGRYLGLPLFPLSVGELSGREPSWKDFKRRISEPPAGDAKTRESFEALLRFSGFPEPFLRSKVDFYNIWFQERKSLLVREDIRSAANIRHLSLLEMLSHMIPERVGAPLSINSLREDLDVAFETVRDWLLLLENFYYLFRIRPFSGSLARTLKKETKAYLLDWVEVADEGFRFENMTAVHLHKAARTWRATGAGDIRLHYVRDKEKREVDFLLVEKKRPVCLVECKLSQVELAPALLYFQDALKVPVAVQLVRKSGVCRRIRRGAGEAWVISADRWLALLP